MTLEDTRRRRVDGVTVCNVAEFVLAADLVCKRAQPVLAPCEQHAMPAAAREEPSSLRADAGRRACDDCYAWHR
jgi:hypothetical protein